jgi:hypothetical protein
MKGLAEVEAGGGYGDMLYEQFGHGLPICDLAEVGRRRHT